LLVQIAFRISAAMRHSDVLVRWGGEEFLVVSRFTSRQEASVLCGRILNAIGAEPLDLKNGGTLQRTCSVGWAPFPWFTAQPSVVPFEDVLRIADRCLYAAKHAGRNQAIGMVSDEIRSCAGDAGIESLSAKAIKIAGPD